MTLHQKLHARYGEATLERPILAVPATGRIDQATITAIQELAMASRDGDNSARDCLYFSLQPRLFRIGSLLRPWPNAPGMTGIWDRDDVRQETWLVFVELLAAWNGSASFITYLLARFAWRLRDRVLRGIGKSTDGFGTTRIPEHLLAELLHASDGEQPESVAMARRFLAEILKRTMTGELSVEDVDAWLELMYRPITEPLVSPSVMPFGRHSASIRRTG